MQCTQVNIIIVIMTCTEQAFSASVINLDVEEFTYIFTLILDIPR